MSYLVPSLSGRTVVKLRLLTVKLDKYPKNESDTFDTNAEQLRIPSLYSQAGQKCGSKHIETSKEAC